MLTQQHDTQVLVMGKISQAAIVAGAAYRNEDTFKLQTGITKTRLIKDKIHHDTKVPGLQDMVCCAIMLITWKGFLMQFNGVTKQQGCGKAAAVTECISE